MALARTFSAFHGGDLHCTEFPLKTGTAPLFLDICVIRIRVKSGTCLGVRYLAAGPTRQVGGVSVDPCPGPVAGSQWVVPVAHHQRHSPALSGWLAFAQAPLNGKVEVCLVGAKLALLMCLDVGCEVFSRHRLVDSVVVISDCRLFVRWSTAPLNHCEKGTRSKYGKHSLSDASFEKKRGQHFFFQVLKKNPCQFFYSAWNFTPKRQH